MNPKEREEKELRILKNNIQLLFEQRELLSLFDSKGISALVIGDSSASICYPNPLTRKLREIDLLLPKGSIQGAALYCTQNGYTLFELPEDQGNCTHLMKNGFTIHLLGEINLFDDRTKNNQFNGWLKSEEPIEAKIGSYIIPTIPYWINGLLQLAMLQIGARNGKIQKQSLIDWMMFVKGWLNDSNWPAFREKAAQLGLNWFAMSITRYGKQYVDVEASWCDTAETLGGFVIVDAQKEYGNNETINSIGLYGWIKQVLRLIYRFIKRSPLCSVFYYINDLYFIIAARMQGKLLIQPEDILAVEENVTFIFKSFNRQRQAKRLYYNIKDYYPNAKVIIADDSEKPLELPDVIHLPFNSGISKGLQAALNAVKTPYVFRLDDDMLLTPKTNIHEKLKFLEEHSEVDLVAVMADHKRPREYALKFSRIRMRKKLIIPAGTMIEGTEVVYKTPNCFIARTEKLKHVGYDVNIRISEHHEFFSRAAGRMVCVLDPDSYIMHCHNMFERKEYDNYRNDIEKANRYMRGKHVSRYQRE